MREATTAEETKYHTKARKFLKEFKKKHKWDHWGPVSASQLLAEYLANQDGISLYDTDEDA